MAISNMVKYGYVIPETCMQKDNQTHMQIYIMHTQYSTLITIGEWSGLMKS